MTSKKSKTSIWIILATLGTLIGAIVPLLTFIQNSEPNNGKNGYDVHRIDTEGVDKNFIVFKTKTGRKYHRNGCIHLRRSRIETTLVSACQEGLQPCKQCVPPPCPKGIYSKLNNTSKYSTGTQSIVISYRIK